MEEIRKGSPVPAALAAVGVPGCVERFVRQTFDLIERGSIWSLASAFTFGREDLLPALFQRIVDELDVEAGGGLEDFRYYLRRHIGLDGGEHGPMAVRLVMSLCGNDEARWQEAEEAAVTALEARRELWDAVHATLRRIKGWSGPVVARMMPLPCDYSISIPSRSKYSVSPFSSAAIASASVSGLSSSKTSPP